MRDHAYAWVLGAGASKPSGIPLGGELVQRWLGELQRRLDPSDQPLAKWATETNLGIPKFKYEEAASFYSRVYERRFADNPDEGFAYLEALMSGKDPSPGYSILAQALEKTPHKVIVSTNFDNLVADALSIYTSTFPLVIGHESLANFVKVISRRPVICKIHRDLLLGPKNDHRSLRRLHEAWAASLRALFGQYTPLFIGYGGNDDSLMDLLESLDPEDIKGQLVWCYYERAEPSERIVELVGQHRGALVPVPDFDLLMVLVGAEMGLEPIDDAIEERAKKRAHRYREQLIALDTTAYPAVRRTLQGAFARAGGSLVWREKARTEPLTDRREQIYLQAVEQYPDDHELQLDRAIFLWFHHRDQTLVGNLLTRLQSQDEEIGYLPSLVLGHIATLEERPDDARAPLERAPGSGYKYYIQAMLWEAQNNLVEAERHYRLAMGESSDFIEDLAWFLERNDCMVECESLWRKTYAEDSGKPSNVVGLASFLWRVRDGGDEVSRLFGDVLGLAKATTRELIHAACFFLTKEDLKAVDAALQLAESRPMADWRIETSASFVRLVRELLNGGDGIAQCAILCRRLAGDYGKLRFVPSLLSKLASSVAPRLPAVHRKFVLALAQAIDDPARRSALGNFPQWRAAAAAQVSASDTSATK